MSFRFNVRDFVAAGELAFRVYQNVYMVAKNAPDTIIKLRDELATLVGSMNILKQEIETPGSIINSAGHARKQMAEELVGKILNTLLELEKVSEKYTAIANEEISKARQIWARVKWAKEVPSVTTLLAKVEHHNSILGLLLTSVGNSSLERIESNNRSMAQRLSELTEMLAATSIGLDNRSIPPVTLVEPTSVTPVISMREERLLQVSLSEKLMEHAERSRPWVLIGLDMWLQAGRWWLMKAQSSLHPFGSEALDISIQAYADLIKAYWIVVDIISKHPHQKYLHGGSQWLQTEVLIETVKTELQKIQTLGLHPPKLSELESADLVIWVDLPPGLDLRPKTICHGNKDHRLWSTPNEEIYFQCFGTYLPGKPTLPGNPLLPDITGKGLCSSGLPAIILFVVDKSERTGRIVVQSQSMVNLLTIPIVKNKSDSFSQDIVKLPDEDGYCVNLRQECLVFATIHECYLLQALIEGFRIYAFYCSGTSINERSLRGFFILSAMKIQQKSVVQYLLENTAEFSSDLTDTSNFTDILLLSCYVAKSFLETSLVPIIPVGSQWCRTIPNRQRSIEFHYTESIEGSDICWRYRIIKAPAHCIQGSWIDTFIKEGLDFHGFDEANRSPLHSAAAAGDLCTLKALIMAGVSIDACAEGGVTAISQAVLNGQHDAIQLLHDAGADLTIGGSYLRFFDCALVPETMARFCITLPRFQINAPCGNSLGELRHWETPIKVSISDYKPMPWLIRMLCEAGAELNDIGIAAYLPQTQYLAMFRKEPERRYNPRQTLLDRALEKVEEARLKEVEELTEKRFLEVAERATLLMEEGEKDMDRYKDRESYNRWLYQVKEYEIWEAEEVVRILKEFGAKLGEERQDECFDPKSSNGLKRRRI